MAGIQESRLMTHPVLTTYSYLYLQKSIICTGKHCAVGPSISYGSSRGEAVGGFKVCKYRIDLCSK